MKSKEVISHAQASVSEKLRPSSPVRDLILAPQVSHQSACVDDGKPVRVVCTFMSMRTATRSCVACTHTVICVIHGLSLTVSLILTHHTLGTYQARMIRWNVYSAFGVSHGFRCCLNILSCSLAWFIFMQSYTCVGPAPH